MKKFRLPPTFQGNRLRIECHMSDGSSKFVETNYHPALMLPDEVRSLTITYAPLRGRGSMALTQQVQVEVVSE